MTEVQGPSRFTFVGTAAMAPGACFLTGLTNDLVDTGRTIQGYGRVYLSKQIIEELANVVGLTPAIDANMQQVEWYSKGYSDAVKKDFDGSLAILVRELSSAADRLELVAASAAVQAYVEPDAEPLGEPAGSGEDVLGSDDEEPRDERTPDAARSSKGRGRVQRTRLDDAFGR